MTVPDALARIIVQLKAESSVESLKELDTPVHSVICPEPDTSPTNTQISRFALLRGMSPPARLKARA